MPWADILNSSRPASWRLADDSDMCVCTYSPSIIVQIHFQHPGGGIRKRCQPDGLDCKDSKENRHTVRLFPFLWFIMLFEKHAVTVWVRKSFQWHRSPEYKPASIQKTHTRNITSPTFTAQTSDSLLSPQASWSSSASGAQSQRFVSSPPETNHMENMSPKFHSTPTSSDPSWIKGSLCKALWRHNQVAVWVWR